MPQSGRLALWARLLALCPFLLASAYAQELELAPRSPTLEDIFALRDLGGLRGGLGLSPDGRRIAVFRRETRLERDDYQYDLLVVDAEPGAAGQAIGDGGDIIFRSEGGRRSGGALDRVARWSPNGRWLAYLARRGDQVELWRSSVDGRVREALAQGPGDVGRFAWLPDGTGLVFETATPRAALAETALRAERDGFLVDDRFEPYHSLRPIPDEAARRAVWVVEPQTRRLRSAHEEEAALLDQRILHGAPPEALDASGSRSGARAWIAPLDPASRAHRPPLGLFHAPSNDQARRCALSECNGRLLRVWLSEDGEEIFFQRAEGAAQAYNAIYAWRPRANLVRVVRRAEELLLDCAIARDRLFCLQESALQPRRIISVDLGSGSLAEIHDPNPQWRSFALTRVERIDVRDAFGEDAFAHLVYPAHYAPSRLYPLVIVQYRSRGFLRGGVGGEYPIHPLAARGYFTLSVDRPEPRALYTRMSAAEVERQTELDGSERVMKQSALDALIANLVERRLVDPARIGVTGISDGAETLYWALTRSRAFAAAVASSPPVDPLAWTLGAERFRQSLRAQAGAAGPWPDAPEPWLSWWRSNATVFHAERLAAPLLMNLPESEALMAFPLYTRLRELGRPVEVYVYPGEYHVKWRPRRILAAQRRALDWLDFWLQSIERSYPNDPHRIERWRAMRDRLTGAAH